MFVNSSIMAKMAQLIVNYGEKENMVFFPILLTCPLENHNNKQKKKDKCRQILTEPTTKLVWCQEIKIVNTSIIWSSMRLWWKIAEEKSMCRYSQKNKWINWSVSFFPTLMILMAKLVDAHKHNKTQKLHKMWLFSLKYQ